MARARSMAMSRSDRPLIIFASCFGLARRLTGQSLVPEPPAIIIAYRIGAL